MKMQKQITNALPTIDTHLPAVTLLHRALPQSGLRVEPLTTLPGPVVIAAESDHRLLIHAGAPTHASYQARPVCYTCGDIDLFPAGVAEEWTADDGSTALLVRLPPALLQHTAAAMERDPARASVDLRCQFRDPQIEHIAWALDAERRAGYLNGHLYTESLGVALAVHLLGAYAAPSRQLRGLSAQELERVTAYIEENLDQDLSLAMLADVAGMSASHLKTLFKRSTGLPVYGYVVQRRVERSKMLLLQGNLHLSQVALETGFAHQSHMARWMRRILGVTPSALLRNSYRE